MKYPIPYRKVDKWGFSTAEKSILIDCIYDEVIYPFSAENFELALVEIAGKRFWINTSGQQISPLADNVFSFTHNGISIIILNEKEEGQPAENCLFINRFGENVFRLPAITAGGFHFKNDLCIVRFANRKYGAVNAKGKIIVEPELDTYEAVFDAIGRPDLYYGNRKPGIEQALIKFEKDRYFGFKDRDGKVILEPSYFSASEFNEDTAMVAKQAKAFYHMDSSGRRLYHKTYYFGFNYEYGIAKVVTDMPDVNPFVHERWGVDYYIPGSSKWGYIDKEGKEFWEDK